jgi:hypothetical protein
MFILVVLMVERKIEIDINFPVLTGQGACLVNTLAVRSLAGSDQSSVPELGRFSRAQTKQTLVHCLAQKHLSKSTLRGMLMTFQILFKGYEGKIKFEGFRDLDVY